MPPVPPPRPGGNEAGGGNDPPQAASVRNGPAAWLGKQECNVKVLHLPAHYPPIHIHEAFQNFGSISTINVFNTRDPQTHTDARITFSPPPTTDGFLRSGVRLPDLRGGSRVFSCEQDRPRRPNTALYKAERTIKLGVDSVDFGVLQDAQTMMAMHTTSPESTVMPMLVLERDFHEIDITFGVQTQTGNPEENVRLRLPYSQVERVVHVQEDNGSVSFYLHAAAPPEIARKTVQAAPSFIKGENFWHDGKLWFRQTSIASQKNAREGATQLSNPHLIVDTARWLTYRLRLNGRVAGSPKYLELCHDLEQHNIKVTRLTSVTDECVSTIQGDPLTAWNWLPKENSPQVPVSKHHFEEQMHQLLEETDHLTFPVRYQLEVCLSQGILHECSIDRAFMKRLASLAEERAVPLLEKVAEQKQRFYAPKDIFSLQASQYTRSKQKLKHCAMIRSAVVTPTTVYYATPAPEMSNRVLRQYSQHQDRFLRVKFTDERYAGRIRLGPGSYGNELLTRIKRTMTNGIQIGDRHYEYLAFGNSQIRDHGAYFFAGTDNVTAQSIRDWMGDFTKMTVIAKYASRIGQCFSTTRPITSCGVKIQRIPDIDRNGYNFTDGVGKMSPFVASMIAHEMKLPSTDGDLPSVYQFRLAGCKGVLVVEPSLKRNEVHIRASQEKFSARYEGLEICKVSKYAPAYLNQQLVLVLSALGVPDHVFLNKLAAMLSNMEQAMHDEELALELLNKNVDINQMSTALADMISDGFMAVEDPFVMSCLRLWRAWSTKFLKEKARLLVEDGTFVFGCVDETATLQGHFSDRVRPRDRASVQIEDLPEVFLQISDPENKGRYKIILGVCLVARNPSLHPGDVRIVRAVDNPRLRHLRNCVVFPQTGDRDIPNMCSGGDLDGDEYLVIWDKDLFPKEWNHAAMDFTPPAPAQCDGEVTVDAMTSFFVTYIKNDNLGQIATNHRYQADACNAGVKDVKCLELARLHSEAVDFVKSGVPAVMPKNLLVKTKPHWANTEGRLKHTVHSSGILGQLFDQVENVPFTPALGLPFDKRILCAYEQDNELLSAARELKVSYDEDLRRLMAQNGVKSEFEAWTTFVLKHNHLTNNYKFAETFGERMDALKEQHRLLCFEKAGTTPTEQNWAKLGPFIAAMYITTAQEVARAGKLPAGFDSENDEPFISFPWIFALQLGKIATGNANTVASIKSSMTVVENPAQRSRLGDTAAAGGARSPTLPTVVLGSKVLQEGDMLTLEDCGPLIDLDDSPTWTQQTAGGNLPSNLEGPNDLLSSDIPDLGTGIGLVASDRQPRTVGTAQESEKDDSIMGTEQGTGNTTVGPVADGGEVAGAVNDYEEE